MPEATLDHFIRAAVDIGSHGDNDTLPFDIDNKFIKETSNELAAAAYDFFEKLERKTKSEVVSKFDEIQMFSERLLVPTGAAGFRITTKIHPFWNIYLNALGVAIAEKHEPLRSDTAHSYRFKQDGKGLFVKEKSWRAYREATLNDPAIKKDGAIVVQTDISSFYEHVYHHRLENCIDDLFKANTNIPTQVDRILSKLSSGRSFGLPVGGQCARILAEVLMSQVDKNLTDQRVIWHRYVDDFTLITNSQEDAYRALSVLSHSLADYGLSLNRTKTTILSAKHYEDYVRTQLGGGDEEVKILSEIDLHFDPYSDDANENYGELRDTVQKLDIKVLLDLELNKGTPDTFLVAQISRTLKFQSPLIAIQLCETILTAKNLNAFRASWSSIMRGLAAVRANEENEEIFNDLDGLLDQVSLNSTHLLLPEANCLHYIKTLRFVRTDTRAKYLLETYNKTKSATVKRACIECWKHWRERVRFTSLRADWEKLSPEEQRMMWLAASEFGDEGKHARNQLRKSLSAVWKLGIESRKQKSFSDLYSDWVENDA